MGPSPWPLDKIQGFLLRGYNLNFVRNIALSVTPGRAVEAGVILRSMVANAGAAVTVTSAEPWGKQKPEYCLTLGFTFAGLQSLNVGQGALATFSQPDYQPFSLGSKARASFVGDTGASAPANWVLDDSQFDVMASLHANDLTTLDRYTKLLADMLAPGFDPITSASTFDTQQLDDGKIYFGYQDGIAQPTIDGNPFPRDPDGQEPVDPGAFMIGTGIKPYYQTPETDPPLFGRYGCFGAFRVLRQDVEGFENQAATLARKYGPALGITDDDVALGAVKALLCGRWPNGTPLALFPIDGNNAPPDPAPDADLNDFTYVLPDGSFDYGKGCPVGAHARRGNMRLGETNNSAPPFPGAPSNQHRVLRRAMPYQLPYKSDNRNDPTTERGLCGLFLGTSMLEQFEFVQHNWINHAFYTDLPSQGDPLMGTIDSPGLATPTKPHDFKSKIGPIDSFVVTKASAYLFFPGHDGIAWIADQAAPVAG